MRHTSVDGRSAVLFGAVGVAGAAIVGHTLRAGCSDCDAHLHGVLTILAPAGMAAAGAVIGGLTSRRRGFAWAVLSGLALMAMGCLVGGLLGLVSWTTRTGIFMGAWDGLGYGAAALVACAPVLWLTQRMARVRPGSIAAESRRLVTWCAGGLTVAVGAGFAVAASLLFPKICRAPDFAAILVVAGICGFVAILAASMSARMVSRARTLCLSPLQQASPTRHPVPEPSSVDLGIGDGLWIAPGDETPYRHTFAPQARVLGDPLAALRSLHDDVTYAILCAIATLSVVTVTLACMPHASLRRSSAEEEAWDRITAASAMSAASDSSASLRGDEEVIRVDIYRGASRCFRAWQNSDPTLSGPLVMGLRVVPSGSVTTVTIPRWAGVSPDTAQCLVAIGRQTRFAPRSMAETLEVFLPFYIP